MPSCDHIARELSDDVDGELGRWKRLKLRLHLWLCPPCRVADRRLRRTVDLLRNLGDRPAYLDDAEDET